MPLHVLSTVLIIRRSKLYYTASGIITPVGGHPGTATYRCDDTRCCIVQFRPPDDENIVLKTFFFAHNSPAVGQGLLIHGVSRSHTMTHHSW